MTDTELQAIRQNLERDWPGVGWEKDIIALLAEVERLRQIEAAARHILYTIPKHSWRIIDDEAAQAFVRLQQLVPCATLAGPAPSVPVQSP